MKKWQIFLVVATGVFMSTLDSSMVNIALPVIMDEFHSPLHKTEWVVMIYLFTITVTLLLWGHLGDRLGRRRIYAAGMLIFAVSSLFCAMSPGIHWLISCRFAQALGAAMMMSTGPAIIKETFPPEQLGRGLGLIGVAVSLGLMTGPPLGGLLIEFYSWRSIFYVTVPIGLVFFLLAGLILPEPAKTGQPEKFDLFGSVAWAGSIILLLLAATHVTAPSWSAARLLATIAASLLGFYFFIKHEIRSPAPLLHLKLFNNRIFNTGILSAVISFAVLFSAILLIPFFLDRVLLLSPAQIGLVMMAIPLSVLVIAPLSGWLYDYVGAQYLCSLGMLLSSLSLLALAGLTAGASSVAVAVKLALLGFGQAMFLSPNSASVLARADRSFTGVSSGLLATARNLGMLLGVAMSGLIFAYFFRKYTNGLDMKDFQVEHTGAFMRSLRVSFQTAAAIGLVGVVVSWLRGPKRS